MQWSDEAILLAVRRHGDSSLVLEALTRSHGRHLGLVRGGRSRSLAAVLQPGNSVALVWRARIDEHLGQYTVEPLRMRAASLIDRAGALYAVQVLAGHLHLLAEREPQTELHAAFEAMLDWVAGESAPDLADLCGLVARFELMLLEALGFGLDLSRCTVTGVSSDLAFVSPKTGRAVSRAGAAGYENRLLPLPPFLIGDRRSNRGPAELVEGLRLTGHFLARDLYAARSLPMPALREELIARLITEQERRLSA